MDLPEKLLVKIVKELDAPYVSGIALGGSYARGDASMFSDVDILLLIREGVDVPGKRVLLKQGKLVSIAPKSAAGIRDSMSRPEKAIRVVRGIRECRVLLDKRGELAEVIAEAQAFKWKRLRDKGNRYAADNLVLATEQAFKVLGALQENEAALSLAAAELLSWLTEIVAVQRGVLVETDHTYYAQVQRTAGVDSIWTSYHKIAAGISDAEAGQDAPPFSLSIRALATLHLYRETMLLIKHILSKKQIEVAMQIVGYTGVRDERVSKKTWVRQDARLSWTPSEHVTG